MGRVWGGNWMNGNTTNSSNGRSTGVGRSWTSVIQIQVPERLCRWGEAQGMHLSWWKAFRNHQCCVKKSRESVWGDFPCSPVVRTLCFPYRVTGSIPSQGTKILHTTQFSSVAQWCPTLCDPMDCSMPGLPVHHQLPELAQTHGHWVGDAIQPSHLLSSPSPPAFNLSQHQGLFQGVSSLHQVAKVLDFQLQHQSCQWIQYWFPLGWLDLLEVQGTLKSLLQHHSWKASILRYSAFFIVQLSHLHMTTGKTIALTRQTFVTKVMQELRSCMPFSVA